LEPNSNAERARIEKELPSVTNCIEDSELIVCGVLTSFPIDKDDPNCAKDRRLRAEPRASVLYIEQQKESLLRALTDIEEPNACKSCTEILNTEPGQRSPYTLHALPIFVLQRKLMELPMANV
jgi:hypothetical protein